MIKVILFLPFFVLGLNNCDYRIKGWPLAMGTSSDHFEILSHFVSGNNFYLNGVSCSDCASQIDGIFLFFNYFGSQFFATRKFQQFGRALDCELSSSLNSNELCFMASETKARLMDFKKDFVKRGVEWEFNSINIHY